MPQYHNIEQSTFGKVRLTPRPFWRKLWKGKPYFVGDRVRFDVALDWLPPPTYQVPLIYERFNDEEKSHLRIKETDFNVVGNIIPFEGDVVYSIGFSETDQLKETIFTARVINHDTIYFQGFWFILGALVTLGSVVLAWYLGFFQIIFQ